jgi:hypothetical protein
VQSAQYPLARHRPNVSAVGTISAGKAQAEALNQQAAIDQQNANFEAAQLDIRANEERAAAGVEAEQQKRQKNLALSRLQALSAAGGFSATDPTALGLADEIERFGTFQEEVAQFGGEARQSDLRTRAQATRFRGQASADARRTEARAVVRGSRFSAAGTILGGIGGAASTFARFRPSTTSAPVSGSAPLFSTRF